MKHWKICGRSAFRIAVISSFCLAFTGCASSISAAPPGEEHVAYTIGELIPEEVLKDNKLELRTIAVSSVPDDAITDIGKYLGRKLTYPVPSGTILSVRDFGDDVPQHAPAKEQVPVVQKNLSSAIIIARNMTEGEVINSSDLIDRKVPANKIKQDALVSSELAIGRRLKWSMTKGAVLCQHELQALRKQ